MNSKYPKYNVQFVIDNFYGGSEIFFEYHDSEITYLLCFSYEEKDGLFNIVKKYFSNQKINKERREYYCICMLAPNLKHIEGSTTQCFDTVKELFDNAVIEGKKLKDIWNDVEIIHISGFDQY